MAGPAEAAGRGGAPFPETGGELQAVRDAERRGVPFLVMRTDRGDLHLVALDGEVQALTIGRHSQNTVSLAWDPRVSRVHARIEWIAADWTVVDDGLSTNGTFVDGDRIAPRARLRDGTTIRLGGTLIVFRDPSSRTSATTAVGDLDGLRTPLTPSQDKVLQALCRPCLGGGLHASPATNAQIATDLTLSVEAVKTHMRALFDRFDIGDLPQNQKRQRVVALAFQWGLVRDLR